MVKFIVFVIITFVSQVHDQTYYVPLSCTFIFRLCQAQTRASGRSALRRRTLSWDHFASLDSA